MQIVRDLAGYSYGRSDLVRRAMSKKKMSVMLEEKEYFINGKLDENGEVEIPGCIRNGISREAAEAIFDDMVSFAQYAFNKSHAAAYGVVAYETGYLKKHYPVEFMAALMTSVMGDTAQIARYIRNCGDMGIEVLPPCVNKSMKKFSVENGKIHFGLLGVKNVGEGAIDAMIRARTEKGEPRDIFSFINNLEISLVNKKAVESLIKAGACDCLSDNRAAMLAIYESLVESAQNTAKKNIEGQMSLFDLAGESMQPELTGSRLPDVAPFDKNIELEMEKEMLGVYLTDHPLNSYKEKMEQISTLTGDDIAHLAAGETGLADGGDEVAGAMEHSFAHDQASEIHDGMKCIMSGMIAGKKTLITKSSKMMAFLDLEDLFGLTEVVVFPNVYERCLGAIHEGNVVAIRGTLNFKEEEAPKILADDVLDLDEACENGFPERRSYGRRGGAGGYGGRGQGSYAGGAQTGDRAAQNAGSKQAGANTPLQQNGRPEGQAAMPQTPADGMIKLRIPQEGNPQRTLDQLMVNLGRHPGNYDVLIYPPGGKAIRPRNGMRTDASASLLRQMQAILGDGNVKAETKKE